MNREDKLSLRANYGRRSVTDIVVGFLQASGVPFFLPFESASEKYGCYPAIIEHDCLDTASVRRKTKTRRYQENAFGLQFYRIKAGIAVLI